MKIEIDHIIGVIIGLIPLVTITIVFGNDAQVTGGGITVQQSASAKIINSTVSTNTAGELGAGILCEHSSSATLVNSIVWGNEGPGDNEIAVTDDSTLTVSYSNVRGGQSNVFVGPGSTLNWVLATNIESDPLFVDVASNDYHLQASSPSIDVATDSDPDLPLTDYEGDPRIIGSSPDMGADEWKPDVDIVNIDIKPGTTQNAINPHDKGSIWVAILSSIDAEMPFDPSSQVDISTVEFGPGGAQTTRYKVKDINNDGLGDLLLRFMISETGITCGDTEAQLMGVTFKDQDFLGSDALKTVGCKVR